MTTSVKENSVSVDRISQSVVRRGFDQQEFEQRAHLLQQKMRDAKVDAVLLTTETDVRYYTGFYSPMWLSPTRPWFVVVPLHGKPIAVIPEIGQSIMQKTWVDEIHCWSAPQPEDDGISLLVSIVQSLPRNFGRLGMSFGAESYVRVPINNFILLQQKLSHQIVDVSIQIKSLRMIKSASEIAKIGYACQQAGFAFDLVKNNAALGMTEHAICQQFKINLLQNNLDECPYVVSASGQSGYDGIVEIPSQRRLCSGDVFIIDTGSKWDGYYCDYDRNWAFGAATDLAKSANDLLYRATTKGFLAAQVGAKMSDIYRAMWQLMAPMAQGNTVGRMGHGLGMDLTEPASITPSDHTVLQAGMVITLEPGMTYAENCGMVHEENIVITEDGPQWLTDRAPQQLEVIL